MRCSRPRHSARRDPTPTEALLAKLAQPETDVEAPPEAVAEPQSDPDGGRAYPVPADLRGGSADDFHERRADARLLADLKAVLAAEAPVHFDLLVRRLTEAWGIGAPPSASASACAMWLVRPG